MSTPIIAIVCALGVIAPLALGFLPSRRKQRASRRGFAQPRWLAQRRADDRGRDACPFAVPAHHQNRCQRHDNNERKDEWRDHRKRVQSVCLGIEQWTRVLSRLDRYTSTQGDPLTSDSKGFLLFSNGQAFSEEIVSQLAGTTTTKEEEKS